MAPGSPSSLKFEDLMGTLKNYFSPKPSVIAERFKFHGRYQGEGESISRYIVELKKLASTRDFGFFENPKQGFRCFRCEGSHAPNLCKFKDEKCYLCLTKCHIAKVCQSKTLNNKTFKTKYSDLPKV